MKPTRSAECLGLWKARARWGIETKHKPSNDSRPTCGSSSTLRPAPHVHDPGRSQDCPSPGRFPICPRAPGPSPA